MKKNNVKRTKRNRRSVAIRFALSLAIVLTVAGIGTILAGSICGKILYTQYKVFQFNDNISGWEKVQKKNYELSRNYIGPYANIAENAGKRIDELKLERAEFLKNSANSSDFVIRWASKNEGDIPTVMVGILGFAVIVLMWIALILNLVHITAIVFKFLNSVVCVASNLFSVIFYGLHLGCYRIQGSSCRNCTSKCRKRIVPYNKRIG